MTESPLTAEAAVARCQVILAHAWMVRTFIKHAPETEEFPELMGIVRGVFDFSRALETRVDDPPGYVTMLRKKLGRLRRAAKQFALDAPVASDHTNFQQAVVSMNGVVAELEAILAHFPAPPPPPMPTRLPAPTAGERPPITEPAPITEQSPPAATESDTHGG